MGKLKVYYGWARIGGVRKKRALSVMFENEMLGCRSERGQRCLRTIQDTVFERYQTDEEEKEGKRQNRIFTEYSLFLDEKPIMVAFKDACLSTANRTRIMHQRLCVKESQRH